MNSYTFQVSLFDFAFIGTLFVGFTFALQLWFAKSTNRSANRFLALALVTMIVWMTRILAIDIRLRTYLPGWDRLPMQFLLALGPLIYFYVLKITRPEYKFRRKDLWHFSPLLLEQTALVLEIRESFRTGLPTYATPLFHSLNPLLQLLIFISLMLYLYWSHKLIQRFYRRLKPVLMDRSLVEFRWLHRLLAATALLWILWHSFAAIDYFGYGNRLGIHVYYPFYILFAVITIWTAAAAFLRPQAATMMQPPALQKPTGTAELKGKGVWLKRAMEANRYYEDPDLTLNALAEKLGLTIHELSRIINTALKKNFSDFINEYRVKAVIAKMQDPAYDRITLLGMALDAGFNSKATFIRVFKHLTGKKPAEYKLKIEKEVSVYSLQPHTQTKQIILTPEVPIWSHKKLNRNYMFRNYVRSAWRNITRHKFISFINIFGLTVGLTCVLLIITYIVNELSYDKYNANADRIYRVTRIFYSKNGEENLHLSSIAPPFGPLLKSAFPDIEKITRVLPTGTTIFRYKDKLFNEQNAVFADENFFKVFTVNVSQGDKNNALNDPYSVMLTPEVAKKYFGSEDPVNKTVILNNLKRGFRVTGVFEPFPANAHMHPDILVSFNTLKDTAIYGEKQLETNFGNNSFYTYLLMPKGYNMNIITRQLDAFIDKYMPSRGMPPNIKMHQATKLTIQKLTDIHLRSHLDDEIEPNSDIKRVYIFSIIALFILLIACINYMNLSTARSALRAKEIGIRKVIGAQRKEIVRQFLGESVLITWVALILAGTLTWLLLPYINNISHLSLSFSSLLHWNILIGVLLLPFAVGLLSGIYPALFMSSFRPVQVLKGMMKIGSGNVSFRQVLVIIQFSVSIILIVATTVVFQQLRYIQNKSLGFNKDFILTTAYSGTLTKEFESFKNELLQNPAVKDVGRSSRIPSGRLLDDQGAQVIDGGKAIPTQIELKYITTDYGFMNTYGMQLAAGRNFSRDFATDTANYVINETAVQQLGWKNPQNAIGKDMIYGGTKGKVIGVVKDFHFESLHQPIIPMIFLLPPPTSSYYNSISIKVDGHNVQSAIATIADTWRKYLPDVPFDYTFLDAKFQKLYDAEQQESQLFTIFSCLAIFIACLGLFGLSAFTISQRVKEIGIRKVLGANIPQIVVELSRSFMILVIIAALIALPVAGVLMHKWLQDFASRIDLSWWVFLLAGIAAFVIAFVTISLQAVKAASANPVNSLRSE
ncbi:MAG TPA: ABC transporter permease [Mucilaginibacter sp.]|nr:ABC transporter permease [Mucilaginibacter sp.]